MFRTTLFAAAVLAATAPSPAIADTQRWTGDGFVLTATTPDRVTAGTPIIVEVSVAPAGSYKINDEFPTALEIKTPADVTTARARLERKDAVVRADRATFRVELTAKAAGTKQLGFKLKFALCTDTTCEPRRHAFDLALDVK